ncbi:polysaccharide pyruvyl transferase family protein [Pseudomonas lini]
MASTRFFHRRLAAFCIGLGPFDGGGKQLTRAVNVINRCDYISVRDGTSQKHCNTFGKSDVDVYTDPTLLSDLWISTKDLNINSVNKKNKYLSFILRDWPHDVNGQKVHRGNGSGRS